MISFESGAERTDLLLFEQYWNLWHENMLICSQKLRAFFQKFRSVLGFSHHSDLLYSLFKFCSSCVLPPRCYVKSFEEKYVNFRSAVAILPEMIFLCQKFWLFPFWHILQMFLQVDRSWFEKMRRNVFFCSCPHN